MCDAFPNKSQSFAGFGCITANRNGWFQIDDSWYITLGPSKSQLGSRNNRFSSCLSYSKSWRCRYKWQLASLPGRCHQFRLCPMMHILTPELCLPECGVTILLKNYLYYIMYIYMYKYNLDLDLFIWIICTELGGVWICHVERTLRIRCKMKQKYLEKSWKLMHPEKS